MLVFFILLNEKTIDAMLRRKKEDIIGEEELNKIPVEECGEPLVKIGEYAPVIIDIKERRRQFPDETLWARKSAADALLVASSLLEGNYFLKIYDAFRPLEYQQKRFDMISRKIAGQNPTWTAEQVRAEAFIYVFPPSLDPQQPPAHSTGGALDLTLVDKLGRDVDMGSTYGDFDTPFVYTNAEGLTKEQRENRVLLMTTMAKAGFVSFPGEWWHYSMGDREYAAYLELSAAKYGRAEDPYKK